MVRQAVEDLTAFWMEQCPDMEYSKARAFAITQIDEAENGGK